jgi:hypothetical protein
MMLRNANAVVGMRSMLQKGNMLPYMVRTTKLVHWFAADAVVADPVCTVTDDHDTG